jgi:crotonobetainyl-CoA:carnitine CoA-transferase CaiB-like acyl-CoA transferase
MLSPYRVLDLTDEKGLMCGKLLGDLGADVIKVERPGGDPARSIGPFYHDKADPERSLFWFAFNTSKRGMTLDIETTEGQRVFRELAKGADFVIESFQPGYMDKLGLGYQALEKINPRVVMVSITPFGQTGPYRHYKAPDMVAWAMGGMMYTVGAADRPPVRISHHSHAYMLAGIDAAGGAMLALCHREMTGKGQHVDVSIQESVVSTTFSATPLWDMRKIIQARGGIIAKGEQQDLGNITLRTTVWPCKDGFVTWVFLFGAQERWIRPLIDLIDSEGMADDFLKGFDWAKFDLRTANEQTLARMETPIREFFLSHTKAELWDGAIKYRAMLYPVSTIADIFQSDQLSDRQFWLRLEHPELGTSLTYPGAFFKSSETPPRISRRAPLIGEHNSEIYRDLSVSKEGARINSSKYPPAAPDRGMKASKKALEGVKVVDFTWYVAGPQITRALAMYGAEVIKIEGRTRLDVQRITPPHKDDVLGVNRGGFFNQVNVSKFSLALNLGHPKGIEVVKKFIARADIAVENFAGGVLEKLGLGYEELKKVKPDIILLSSSMQGQTGRHANHPGFGMHLTSLSGFNHITGWFDRDPASLGVYTDFIGPRFGIIAILAALDYRRRTGKGQYLDLSQYENGIHIMAPLVLDYGVNKRIAERMGNRYPYAVPHGAYRCRGEDRWCAIAVFADDEWASFCKVIGNPAWTGDPRFTTFTARKEHEDELDKLVESWTVNYSAEDVMRLMQEAGVPGGILETGEDLVEHDPQLMERHYFWKLEHPEVGEYYASRLPFVLSRSPYQLRRAPLLGEHNEYVLKEMLGMSDDEIAELVIEGVIE